MELFDSSLTVICRGTRKGPRWRWHRWRYLQRLQTPPDQYNTLTMNRTPKAAVRLELKREVGFGCPVPDCGNPYLYWHHFDPPWEVRQHHDPEGMIALCGLHHPKADAGTYSKEQLREFKRRAAERAEEVKGRFECMRHSLLAVVGGNFYYETPIVFQFRSEPIVWFNRDANGYLLLNVRMLSTSRCLILAA